MCRQHAWDGDDCPYCEIDRLTKENEVLKQQLADDDGLTIAYINGRYDAKEEVAQLKAEVGRLKLMIKMLGGTHTADRCTKTI